MPIAASVEFGDMRAQIHGHAVIGFRAEAGQAALVFVRPTGY